MKHPNPISITKRFPSGAYELSAIKDNRLVSQVFIGFTKKEALKLFKEELKTK